MDHQRNIHGALFRVYLRLRPPPPLNQQIILPERILTVEETCQDVPPTHVILNPPNDNRRRAVEKFSFTHIFKEDSSQLDVFQGVGVLPLIEGALGLESGEGRDGLLATLGVTGSGKTHTILGSRSQRGIVQLALDVLFRSISKNIPDTTMTQSLLATVAATDPSEAQIIPAQLYFDTLYNDSTSNSRAFLRAQTPIIGESNHNYTPRRNNQGSPMPCLPDINNVMVCCDPDAEYAILISMYEVYNDRIFDLLTPASPTKSVRDSRRRALLYKHTEQSPHRKVVAGLRKILCGSIKEALMVLEAGLHERQVAGTGSNSVSSRSHGFFTIEIKKRRRNRMPGIWKTSTLTIVDLAGSERARDAKTQGSTLAEAGKINESLMYLGQCLQIQSDPATNTKPNLVPFRQCKLTELLFSNLFPHSNSTSESNISSYHNPQKAIMIVMADPLGDFNATSQMLRYSALAREVTVPRIPSVSSTILAQSAASQYFHPTRGGVGRGSPSDGERETMEIAALEIARLSEETDGLRAELRYELERRTEVELQVEALSNRLTEIEAETREECFQQMEQRLELEIQRWKATWAIEMDLKDEHLDRKLDIFTRSVNPDPESDGEDKENLFGGTRDDLEIENVRLRREVETLKRDLQSLSPIKPKRLPLRENRTITASRLMSDNEPAKYAGHDNQNVQTYNQHPQCPKKGRSPTPRRWEFYEQDDTS